MIIFVFTGQNNQYVWPYLFSVTFCLHMGLAAMGGVALIDLSPKNRFYWHLVLSRYFWHCAQPVIIRFNQRSTSVCLFYVYKSNPLFLFAVYPKDMVWFWGNFTYIFYLLAQWHWQNDECCFSWLFTVCTYASIKGCLLFSLLNIIVLNINSSREPKLWRKQYKGYQFILI